jgi:hypothetical protein
LEEGDIKGGFEGRQSPANLPGAQTEYANSSLSGVDPTRRRAKNKEESQELKMFMEDKELSMANAVLDRGERVFVCIKKVVILLYLHDECID